MDEGMGWKKRAASDRSKIPNLLLEPPTCTRHL